MIERIMFFALGFLAMGMLGLAFLPAYWRRAERLTSERIQARMPMTMAEIVGERDALRAETAAQIRLVEIKSEAIRGEQARDRVELGRRIAELDSRGQELSRLSGVHAEAERELAAARRALAEAEAGLSSTLKETHDLTGLTQRLRDSHAELLAEHRDLEALSDSQRMTIAGLDTRVTGLELGLEDKGRELDQAKQALVAQEAAARELEKARDGYLSEREEVQRALARLQARHDKLLARAAQLEGAAGAAQAARTDIAARLAQANARADAAELSLEAATRREQEMAASLRRGEETGRAADAAFAQRLDELKAEIAMLQARPEAGEPAEAGLLLLRQSIADVGAEMVRLHRALEQNPADPIVSVGEKMRALQARAGRAAASG